MIKLSSKMILPDMAATWKMAILGRTGSGKTTTAVVMAEQMIANNVPVVILDPQGDWWGIRSKYPVAILGGEHSDVPLEPTGGALVADFVVSERIPVLIDLFSFSDAQMVRFATDFATRLWTKNRDALHVFLDEADMFAAQRTANKSKHACLQAWEHICSRGRSRGLGLTMMTQRSAKLNKDLLTQADPVFIHRMTAPQDLSAVESYLKYHGHDKIFSEDLLRSTASLEVGSAITISPGELNIEPVKIKVSNRKSYNSSATPKPGQTKSAPKRLADVDLSALQAAMSSAIEEQKKNDPSELKAEIRRLQSRLENVDSQTQGDQEAIANAVCDAIQRRDQEWRISVSQAQASLKNIQARLQKAAEILLSEDGQEDVGDLVIATPSPVDSSKLVRPARSPMVPKTSSRNVHSVSRTENSLPKGEQKVLCALAQYPDGCTNSQLTVLLNYRRSSRNAYLQRLREKDFVEKRGDRHVATDAGKAELGDSYEPLPVGAELRQWWKQNLSGGELSIFELLEHEGNCDPDEISSLTGYKRSSRNAYLQRLRAKELVVKVDDGYQLSETLFGNH